MSRSRNGRIITFYSYKGGTGRSMVLANAAWLLASSGRKVAVIDWDLEAPGLHRYFYPFLPDPCLESTEGLVDLVVEFELSAPHLNGSTTPPTLEWFDQQGERVLESVISLRRAETTVFPGGGALDFIPAGKQGTAYATRVNSFDWRGFYERRGGWAFFESVKKTLRAHYDYVLIDSRTGVSDTSGICTVQMPDVLVGCFTLNNQGIEGTAGVLNSAFNARVALTRAGGGAGPGNLWDGLAVLPVPMRVEMAEKDKLEARLAYARQRFGGFPNRLPPMVGLEQYWVDVSVPYVPYYAYEELLASFADLPGDPKTVLAAVERLTAFLLKEGEQQLKPALVSDAEREQIRALYARDAMQALSPAQPESSTAAAEQAERAVAALPGEDLARARRVFLRLVRAAPPEEGGDSWRRLPFSAFPEPDLKLVRYLIRVGILTIESDRSLGVEYVRIADERVLSTWPRLAHWLDENREFLQWKRSLALRVGEWEASEHHWTTLMTGRRLKVATEFLHHEPDDLTPEEQTYIRKSQDFARLRRWMITSAVLFLLAIGAVGALVALGRVREVERESREGRAAAERIARNMAPMWVRKARDEMENNDFEAARTSLSQAVQANTTYVDAYYQLANLERFEGNAFAAVQNYSRAIELNPELTAAYDGRASALLQIGDTVHAVADLEKVSKSGDPRRRAAADSLLNLVRRGVPPPATTRGLPPILVFYRDSSDVATAKMVERTLDQAGYPASRPRRENLPFTHFTVRYFHREDQARADSIRRLVNRMLEALPVAPTVELLPLTEDYAPAGHLEVWVPGKAPLPVTPPAVTPSPGVDSTPPSSSVAPVTTPTRG